MYHVKIFIKEKYDILKLLTFYSFKYPREGDMLSKASWFSDTSNSPSKR